MTDTKQPEALFLAEICDSFPGDCLPAVAKELRRQHAEIKRLTECLRGANSQAEEFERGWYLRGGEIEDKDARMEELEAENRALKEQHEAIGAGGVTGLRGAAIEPDMHWISGDEEPVNFETLHEAALDLAERAHPAGSRIEEKIYCAKSLPSVTLAAWYDENEGLQYEIVDAAIAQEGGK